VGEDPNPGIFPHVPPRSASLHPPATITSREDQHDTALTGRNPPKRGFRSPDRTAPGTTYTPCTAPPASTRGLTSHAYPILLTVTKGAPVSAADTDNLIHLEIKRSLWTGKSTTACGQTVQGAESVWTWFTNRKWCPTCKAYDKATRR